MVALFFFAFERFAVVFSTESFLAAVFVFAERFVVDRFGVRFVNRFGLVVFVVATGLSLSTSSQK